MVLRENITILVSLLLSIGLHLLILPVVYSKKPPMAYLPPVKATHLETPAVEKPDIELGIDKSKESTLTWIGYQEYEEQRARFATVEQAAMKTEVDVATAQPSALSVVRQITKPVSKLATQLLEALQGIAIATPDNALPTVQADVEVVVTPPIEVKEDVPIEGDPSDRDSEQLQLLKFHQTSGDLGNHLQHKALSFDQGDPRLPQTNS